MKVLLIEDDTAMRTTLERAFGRLGWLVNPCGDGALALHEWQRLPPDVVLLDLSLPGCDGLQLLEQARKQGLTTPVIILTARGTVGDKILGLNTGADDYLPKPFDLDELEARMRALVRAHARASQAALQPLQAQTTPTGQGGVDFEAKSVYRQDEYYGVCYEKESGAFYVQGQALELSPREAGMLAALMERSGQAVTKERLFERLFAGTGDVQVEAVEVVAYRLRKKLQHTRVRLVTLRGLGYLLKGA